MSHREIDAKELRCPFIPGVDRCLTKGCMAWRWVQGHTDLAQLRTVPTDRTLDRDIFKASLEQDRKDLQKRGYKLSREATPGEVIEYWRRFLGDEREGSCARVEPASD